MIDTITKRGHRSYLAKIAKNAGISGVGEIAFSIIGYATSILITRTVGSGIYGIFSLANIISWIAQVFSSAGMQEGVLRYVAYYKSKGDLPRVKGVILFGTQTVFILGVLLAVALFFLSDYIADRFFHNIEVSWAIKVLISALPFLTLGELWLRTIQSFQEVKYQVYIQKIISPVIKIIILFVLFLIGMKLEGILIASVITTIAVFVMSFYYLTKIFPLHHRLPAAVYERKELIFFSLPLSLTQLLGVLTFYIDSLMIGYFLAASDVGIYTVVGRLAILIVLPLTAINSIFAPMISELYGKNEFDKLSDLFKTVTKWIFVLSFLLFLIYFLFSEPILSIFGDDFVVGASALVILGIGQLVNAAVGSVGYILMMTGRVKIVLANSIFFCVSNIILNYYLIPRYGIIGAAIATGISIILTNGLRLLEVYILLKIHPFSLNYIKPVFAGFISTAIMMFITRDLISSALLISGLLSLLFIALYIALICLFKLEDEDKFVLQLVLQKLGVVGRTG